jgi:hypothetical protein
MSKITNEHILEAWDEAEEEFPDNSTEFLAAIVADRLGIEYSLVFDALWARRVT